MRLMLEEENRDRRKEWQKIKKEDWNQRYWQKETEVITSKMDKLELDENFGVAIMKEILARVTEIAEKALEMGMDISHNFEVVIESNLGVGNWVDLGMEMEAAGAGENMDMEMNDSLGKLEGKVVGDITPDGQTEVVVDLADRRWPQGWQ